MPRRLDAATRRIASKCICGTSVSLNVQTVTFQPRDNAVNQDRVVAELWIIQGDRWLFLAVFDGRFGPVTVEYTANTLPTLLRRRLRTFLDHELQNKLDRTNIHQYEFSITALIKKEIEGFDQAIGEALQRICPKPEELTEEEARRLVEEHGDIVSRAFEGTTLAFALVNVEQRFMWAATVGDSTVAISILEPDGKRRSEKLCDVHTFKNPQEYFRTVMAHLHSEQPLLDWEDRIIGWLSVPRAIGDFALKLPSAYLTNLFRYTPYGSRQDILKYASKIVTPPYIISEPSVRFTDLDPVWAVENKILLFTDGVDNLVDGYIVFTPQQHSGADPVDVVSNLLSDEADPKTEEILGHPITPKWSREDNNKPLDILGNLLGGTDVRRLEMVTDEDLLRDTGEGWPFHIDDTSIIVWGLLASA
ncbi:protein serine/threonine phosphatase 2C [Pilatotrama ljubarskyi]|nr:protein serine/threonine phosphatase 2C [Pilatotrama ljubarskyi]